MKKSLNERDLETLEQLSAVNTAHKRLEIRDGWAKPLDIGGSDASHHSRTLRKLVRHGLAVIQDPRNYSRGKFYKVTDEGEAMAVKWRIDRYRKK